MKIYFVLSFAALGVLTACEQNLAVETVVHTDGSLDRAVSLQAERTDHALKQNIFGAVPAAGWDYTIVKDTLSRAEALPQKKTETVNANATEDDVREDSTVIAEEASEIKTGIVRLTKHFASVDEANRAMNATDDTLFHIESHFGKRFRWFYTYIRYSDTYKAINRFHTVPDSDYFTKEDYAFIDRLPAEGRKISKADSLYLDGLTRKIFDVYGLHILLDEYFNTFRALIQKPPYEARWVDTLNHHKRSLYQRAAKDNADDDFMLIFADSIGVPLTEATRKEYADFRKALEKKLTFVNLANAGKYVHRIEMPWAVVETNGDSLAGRSVFWKPPVTKFLLRDYTMYAEARTLNYWAVILSGMFVVFAGVLVFRKRKE